MESQVVDQLVISPEDSHGGETFDRRLGLWGAVSIGMGAMLGGGIYVISGVAAGIIGPLLVLAYLITGILTIFTAINYAELASSIPKQGGGYTYNRWVPSFLYRMVPFHRKHCCMWSLCTCCSTYFVSLHTFFDRHDHWLNCCSHSYCDLFH